MHKTILATLALVCTTSTLASAQPLTPKPLFDTAYVNMTYPQVSGDYLVYNQRIKTSHQIMRLNRNHLYDQAQEMSKHDAGKVVRNAIALAHGRVAYVNNRLGHLMPWLATAEYETSIGMGIFQNLLLPNHIEASDDAKIWVFDSTLEPTRTPRIINQFNDERLHTQLLGQNWRMYHSKLWAYKSGYPETKTGLNNKFQQPYLFTFSRGNNEVTMLNQGFDASLSPDGQRMVFVRETHGNFDLWMQNIDGTGQKRLTTNTYADVEPSFSPDGQRIAFVSNRDSHGDITQTFIYTLELATGKITTVTSGMGTIDGGPDWLDNNTIIFHSNRNPKSPSAEAVDNWRLWTVALPK